MTQMLSMVPGAPPAETNENPPTMDEIRQHQVYETWKSSGSG